MTGGEQRDHYEDPLLRAMVDDDLIATGPSPAIVAANQPEPNDDLSEALAEALSRFRWAGVPTVCSGNVEAMVEAQVTAVKAFVAAQVTAARADAFREAANEVHRERLWQLEVQTRGLKVNNDPVERFGVVEEILTDRAEALLGG